MAMEAVESTDKIQKFIDHLEARQTILSTCTELFTSLTTHFTSLQNSLSQKSQTLDSKFQSLESNSKQTLESLSQRETSIPERESSATAKVQQQKENAIAEFQKPLKLDNLADSLKSFSRRMDSSGLLKLIMSRRKESVHLRAGVCAAVMEAVDPAVFILDAVDEFVSNKIAKLGVTDKRWACGLLVQEFYLEGSEFRGKQSKHRGPEFARSVVDRAAKILDRWMVEEVDEGGGGGVSGVLGSTEAVMFLQMVVIFGLRSRFDDRFLMKLVMDYASRRDMARIAEAIGFGDKMEEMIDDLVKNGKEIEAVYFASESGLTEKYSPVSLIKSHIRTAKKNNTSEDWNSIKAFIKCIEDHKLESDFPLDSLKKKANELEKIRAKRKKSLATASILKINRPQRTNDRKPPAPRPAKKAKISNTHTPFGHINPPPVHSSVARYPEPYNYPSSSVTPYRPSFGASHSQSPAVIPQQHYPISGEIAGVANFHPGSSYGVQANYATYDYSTAAPPVFQPSSYTQ